MSWKNISSFLDRFQNLKPPKEFMADESAKIINDLLGASLVKEENVDWRGGILYIKIKDSSLRNQLFINKERILGELEKKLGKRSPKDIRF